MLAYSTSDASTLLTSKMKATNAALERVVADLVWLRDQITTTQVNIARVYNWEVKQRRSKR